jgi:hypothetical protein
LDKPFPLQGPPVKAANRRGDAGLVNKGKALRIKSWLPFLQGLACGGDVRPVLLGGPQTFF